MVDVYRHSRRVLLVLCSVLLVAAGVAQHTVSGVITDAADGAPLIGATIAEMGTTTGTVTDFDGGYSLDVSSAQATLSISYIGYTTVEIPLDGRNELSVALTAQAAMLDEVIVVGYGTQRKSDLTGAVGKVDGERIVREPVANIEQALQGKVAGVYVQPNSGTPGAGAVVRIRGTGTLNNANPLYVIDGMITYDASFVDPKDVASVEVLKDASSSAIYGSRGANGVIIITTKSGQAGRDAVVTASGFYGSQMVTNEIDLLNAAQFGEMYNELRGTPYYPDPSVLGEGTNWQDEIFRMAPIYSMQLGASGGSEKITFNISANYFNQDGVIKNSSFERITARLNTTMELNEWLSFGANLAYANQESQVAPSVVTSAYRMPPVFEARDSTGDFTDPTFFGLAIANPAADLYYKSDRYVKGNKYFGNVYGDIKFLKYFTFRSNFGFDNADDRSRYFEPKFEVSASQRNANDRLSVEQRFKRDWIWEQTLRFNREWDRHRVNALVGYTAEERYSEWLGGSRENFPGTADELLYLSAGNDTTEQNYGGAVDEAQTSMLFRVNYTLDEKYLVTFTWRTDWSSRFTADNRRASFPSIGVGWNMGYEDFIADLGVFDRLKLRASYGILGNQNSAQAYPSAGAVSSGLYAVFGTAESLNQGATLISLANPDLQWETSRQLDIGLEAGFLNNRLSVEVDWYDRLTYDIIAAVPIPDYVGSQSDPVVNTAEVQNTGWDITLGWRDGKEFQYHLSGTFSPVHNEVKKLAEGKNEIFSAFIQGEPATRTVVGLPVGAFYGYRVAGVFQNEEELASLPSIGGEEVGDLRFEDVDGNGVIDGDDRVYLGSPIPTLTYGFNGGFEWKGLDFSIDFWGQSGNKVFNQKETARFGVYNWEQHVYDRWTPENPSDTEPRITNGGHNYRVSDRFVLDGGFFRLRNITIGYSLPTEWLEKLHINQLRVYATGQNLWTQQNYTGYSPEFPNSGNPFVVGFDNGAYPVTKSFQGGIELRF